MIKKAECLAGIAADQAAGDCSRPLGVLVRIDDMHLRAACNLVRSGSCFPSANSGMGQSQRKEDVRIAQRVMIEEIARSGAEVAYVECPALEWNCNAEFALFV